MTDIVMGLPAIDRAQSFPAGYTILQLDNPSQYSGRITSIEVWFYTGASSNFNVGTFYGSGTSYTCRSYCICGAVAAGSKQVIPVNIQVEVGDVIGIYYATGTLENYAGAGAGTQKYANANYFDASVHTYSEAAQSASLQAIGVTIAADIYPATWNPSDTYPPITFSNSNLTVAHTNSSWFASTRATAGKTTGKWYWEVTINSINNIMIGIATFNNTFDSGSGFCSGPKGYAYYNNGKKYIGPVGSAYGATYTTGDVIGFALDLVNGTLTCYKNNSSQGILVSALSGTYYAAIMCGLASTVNFGASAFVYTPPSGFLEYTAPVYDTASPSFFNGLQTIPHDITKYSQNPIELVNIVNRQRIGLIGTTYHNYIGA